MPNLLDPDFEPTDEQLAKVMRGFSASVRADKAGVELQHAEAFAAETKDYGVVASAQRQHTAMERTASA